MIRRLPAALASVALAAMITSGCSTFTKNNNAATVNGRHLSVKDFEALENDVAQAPDSLGEHTGDSVRGVLTAWVNIELLVDALAAKGIHITSAQRADAEKTLSASDAASWAKLSPITKAVNIDNQASKTLVTKSTGLVPDDAVQAIYESGGASTVAVCLRLMAFGQQAKAESVYAELTNGGDFGTLASANSEDTSTAPTGGIVKNSSGSECIDASTLSGSSQGSAVLQLLKSATIGTPTRPAQVGNFYYIFMERPYSEVKTSLVPIVGPSIFGHLAQKSAKAVIDSRYGMWDATTGQVVATR